MEERLQKGVVNFAPGPAQIPLEVRWYALQTRGDIFMCSFLCRFWRRVKRASLVTKAPGLESWVRGALLVCVEFSA